MTRLTLARLGPLSLLLAALVSPMATAAADGTVKPDDKGRTALMLAAKAGDLAASDRLLAAGADIDARNPNGGTALMYAALGGSEVLVDRLLAAGADVNARASNGWNALMIAAAKGRAEIVQRLLAAGADINAQDVYGWTPLMRALYETRAAVVAVLLASPNIALDAREERGATALHVVAQTGDEALARKLLERGARRDARNRDGLTPADIALRMHHDKLSALLSAGG